jgi:hypothetical protein
MLWLNHFVAVFDSFRAARFHNLQLAPSLGFKVRSNWRRGRPEVLAAIERRF